MPGYIKHVFPGGNTPNGFHSFYDNIVSPSANRIYILKGGPGTGKSTFMKSIAEKLVELGFSLEHHHCSSDNNSLDGIYVPALDIAMIDGTAPHIVDPKNPGAVDEIIHLGDYWDEDGMKANKTHILSANKEVGRLFKRAYGYLSAAKDCMNQVESCYNDSGSLDITGLNTMTLDIADSIFKGLTPLKKSLKQRHLFASAITPEGPKHYLESIVGLAEKRYLISGDWGTGRTTAIRKVADYALALGYDIEAFHCPMDPGKIDHLYIPEVKAALVNNSQPHVIEPLTDDWVFDTSDFVKSGSVARLLPEISLAKELYKRLFEEATVYLSRAKKIHDEMETYYVPNMDFDRIEAIREKTLQKILKLAASVVATV